MQEKREGSHSPGHSRAHLSLASAFMYQHAAAAAAGSHLHPELPWAGPNTTSTAPPEAERVWATYSTTRYTPGPGFLWHFLYPGQWSSDWPSVTRPCLLLAMGFIPAALYLPIIIRKAQKYTRNHHPSRHLMLGSVLVLVRKNGYNTLQLWLMPSASI